MSCVGIQTGRSFGSVLGKMLETPVSDVGDDLGLFLLKLVGIGPQHPCFFDRQIAWRFGFGQLATLDFTVEFGGDPARPHVLDYQKNDFKMRATLCSLAG